jgi:hypothetical protein
VSLLAIAIVVAFLGTPAAAHSDDGEMTVTSAEATSELTVDLEVGIVYANDGEPAEEATVTATATRADGSSAGPFELPNVVSARYGATLTLPEPGAWTIQIAATGPEATASTEVDTTLAPTTTSALPTTSTSASTSTTTSENAAATTGDDGSVTTATSAPADEDGGASAPPGWLIAAVALAIVAAGGAGLAALQRRDRDD